ncbi:MAG: AAA family ATPase [Clostridia bacterium]|nr:AAA family ATPase [Clostridia bacterium]
MQDFLKAFDKVIGYDDEKRKLMPICDMMRKFEKYKRLGVVMPSGALLQGEPGYGKTLLAKCFIEACGVPHFLCRKDKADGDFIDYMTKCFDEAVAAAPAIVFLDDMDKFANEDKDHRNAEEYVAVQSCIDNVKGKNVFVIATTNDLYNLPESLLRAGRFDINLEMQGLDRDDQIKLIKYFLGSKSFLEEIPPEQIQDIIGGWMSCAELEKIINDAAIKVAFENRDTVTRDDIIFACLNHHFGGVDTARNYSEEKRKRMAYHEAGHVVVREVLDPNTVSLVSIKAYKSSNGGVTCFCDGVEKSFEIVINQVKGALGGKAATEIVFEETDIGTRDDIKTARYALEKLRDKNAAFGFESQTDYNSSDATRRRADDVLSAEMNKCYEVAKTIISDHRDFLDAVAAALLEKETIFATDIAEIKKNLHV